MHHYHKLREKLGESPIGAPETEEFLEILKLLFGPDEVEVALLLEFRLKRLSEIVHGSTTPQEEIKSKLEALADKGAILAKQMEGEPGYALLPNYPGLFEYPIMKGGDEKTQKRLAELWHAYYMKAMAAELAAARPPWNRVFPAEAALEEVYEILPFQVASQMMAGTKAVALADCPCRVTGGNCDKPLDVCLSFDGAARFLAERGMARLIDLEEALEVLKKAEEAGLVHIGSNNAQNMLFLCNCCSCCCHFLKLVAELGYGEALAKSAFEARLDEEMCTGCGICAEERCPVEALKLQEETVRLDTNSCIGCGLCVTTCPSQALTLVKRLNYESPPATAADLVRSVVANKKD